MAVWLHTSLISALDRGEWSVGFTTRPIYPQGKAPDTHRRLGGTQSRSGRGREEKNSQNFNIADTSQRSLMLGKLKHILLY
jgi:hypothetical protein